MRIMIAMSGGVDSSVVAHLLKEQGHDVVGVRFTLWTDPLAPPLAQILPSKCCNAQTVARCNQVAKDLEIPLHILDLEEEFKRDVVDPFLDGYKEGNTPNPCIGCNRTVKFGRLLEFMKEHECEKLATGHYARVAIENMSDDSTRHVLLEAIDKQKDQSYYLYGLDQEQLSKVLFPLGSMQKKEVFELAQHFGVPYDAASYRESQDLCFFPEKEPKEFLKRHLKDALEPGEIVRKDDGTVVGTHNGLPLYTIGQRRIGVGGLQIPLEVVAKDVSNNRLLVAEKGSETIESVTLKDIRWTSWKPDEDENTPFECRLRSLSPRVHGNIHYKGSEGTFVFDAPQPRQAAGQSLVMYRGEEIIGGGVMT